DRSYPKAPNLPPPSFRTTVTKQKTPTASAADNECTPSFNAESSASERVTHLGQRARPVFKRDCDVLHKLSPNCHRERSRSSGAAKDLCNRDAVILPACCFTP